MTTRSIVFTGGTPGATILGADWASYAAAPGGFNNWVYDSAGTAVEPDTDGVELGAKWARSGDSFGAAQRSKVTLGRATPDAGSTFYPTVAVHITGAAGTSSYYVAGWYPNNWEIGYVLNGASRVNLGGAITGPSSLPSGSNFELLVTPTGGTTVQLDLYYQGTLVATRTHDYGANTVLAGGTVGYAGYNSGAALGKVSAWEGGDAGAADTTAPVITGPTGAAGAASISVNVVEGTTAVGDWNADEAVTFTLLGTDAAFFSINASTGVVAFLAAPAHASPADAGANNTYDIVVRATDAASNFSEQSVAVNVTASTADTTNPGAPGTPSFVSVTKNSATVNYTAATDNVAVTGYEYRINGGSVVGLGSVLTFPLSSLTPGTAHNVEVRAYDAAGNRGAWALGVLTTLIYGFDLDTATGAVVGSISGALTGLGKTTGVDLVVCAYSTADDTLVATSGSLACTAGRLPRWEHPALDAATYDLKVRPAAGGAPGWLRLGATL